LYGEHIAVIEISSLVILQGHLPPRALGMVIEWATIHREELLSGLDLSRQMQKPPKIAPLP